MFLIIVKLKILTYCLGLLVAGFVIATPGSNSTKGKVTANQTIFKISSIGFSVAENTLSNPKGDNTNYAIFHSTRQSLLSLFDFQIEQIIARHENQFRTSRRFATCLKI